MARRTAEGSRRSTACQLAAAASAGGGRRPPGRYQAQRLTRSRANNSTRWLPANPAAPVTSTVFGIDRTSARNAAHRPAERREITETGQREGHEEPAIDRHGQVRD